MYLCFKIFYDYTMLHVSLIDSSVEEQAVYEPGINICHFGTMCMMCCMANVHLCFHFRPRSTVLKMYLLIHLCARTSMSSMW